MIYAVVVQLARHRGLKIPDARYAMGSNPIYGTNFTTDKAVADEVVMRWKWLLHVIPRSSYQQAGGTRVVE